MSGKMKILEKKESEINCQLDAIFVNIPESMDDPEEDKK